MTVLRLENLVKSFGGIDAVNRVSLQIEAGDRHAILGPNGAGKTTLFNLISGIYTCTSGRITLFDQDVSAYPVHRRAALGLSRTFQISNLFFGLTLFENILLSVQAREACKFSLHRRLTSYKYLNDRVESYLKRWNLGNKRDDVVANLSHGEQRQLEIIMALATNPRFLLLDEPTAGLSTADTAMMAKFLKEIERDITILLIEHDMAVAFEVANYITVMHYGRIIADGSPEEIRKNSQVLEIYFGED